MKKLGTRRWTKCTQINGLLAITGLCLNSEMLTTEANIRTGRNIPASIGTECRQIDFADWHTAFRSQLVSSHGVTLRPVSISPWINHSWRGRSAAQQGNNKGGHCALQYLRVHPSLPSTLMSLKKKQFFTLTQYCNEAYRLFSPHLWKLGTLNSKHRDNW